jgi:hypothetical protein
VNSENALAINHNFRLSDIFQTYSDTPLTAAATSFKIREYLPRRRVVS